MPSLQDAGKPTSRRHPPTARHAALEVGGFAEMPIMPEGSSRAAGAHDQVTETQEITPYKWVHPDEDR